MKKIGVLNVIDDAKWDGCLSLTFNDVTGLKSGMYALYVDLPAAVEQAEAVIAAACGCIPDAGIVCDTCAAMADKNIKELAEYVDDFITKRFPSGLEGDIRTIISECVLDAFHDGARWAEAQPPAAGLIITDLEAAPKRSIIIASR